MSRLPNALGVLYLLFGVGHGTYTALQGRAVSMAQVEVLLVGGLGLVMLYWANRLSKSDLHPDVYPRIAVWTLGGLGMTAAILAPIAFTGDGLDRPLFYTALITGIGCVGGLATGTYEAQSRSQAHELREERDLRERILQTSPVGIVIIDTDGSIDQANEYAAETIGLSKAELTAIEEYDDPRFEAVGPDGDDAEKRAIDEVLETGEPVYDVVRGITTPDGDRIWLSANVAPLHGMSGELDGVILAFEDITERKERERKLRQQRERLTALNSLNEVVRDINRAVVKQSTREEIESIVCERLTASDSYEFAWVGTVDEETREIRPSTSANTRGYLDEVTVTADERPTGQGPSGTAVRTGETKVVRDIRECSRFEPWREAARERDISASAAIPIDHEDRFYGVLNVYTKRENAFDEQEREVISQLGEIVGLALTAIEHERQLQRGHERLAFINSLLRHNLLNDLNIVHARAGILEPHVDAQGQQHLEVIQTHADEMADLIDTLRSLTEALVEDDHELKPVDIGAILGDEIDKVSGAFEGATFDTATSLDDAPEVLADELLNEVFRNLLVNAVQHNDKDTPRTTVDVTSDGEHVTVEVADNGPGIPEGLKHRLFDKGEKHRHSQGTGYGLHLVQEIVDLYGGEITAENTDTGATFSVSLPRA